MRLIARDSRGRFAQSAPIVPARVSAFSWPGTRDPRYRLRVFGRVWPWRATRAEAYADAKASGNGSDGFLTVPAVIQRDPPHDADRWRMMRIREERGY